MNDSFREERAPERRREGGIQGKLSGAWFPEISWLLLDRLDGRGGRAEEVRPALASLSLPTLSRPVRPLRRRCH